MLISKSGISTISAHPVVGVKENFWGNSYIFWDFKDNIVMTLKARTENYVSGDAVVSWQPKRIVSAGDSNCSLNEFQNMSDGSIGGEIAFYRRKRNHDAIENEKYGIVAGVSLPMLIEMVSAQMTDEESDIKTLMEKAIEAGKAGIQTFHASAIAEEEEDDL